MLILKIYITLNEAAEKVPLKTWKAKKCVQKAWCAKFNLGKLYHGAYFTFNTTLCTTITSNHIKCTTCNNCNFVLTLYQLLLDFWKRVTKFNFQKVQREHEKVLTGIFLPPGVACPPLFKKLNMTTLVCITFLHSFKFQLI